MPLILTEDQTMLAETARDFASKQEPGRRLRRLRDARDPAGHSPEVWRQMAELGWLGIPFDEAHGGLGLGLAEVVVVTEALGRGLCPEPYLASVMLGGSALALGSAAQQETWLPKVIAGDCYLALAHDEDNRRFSPYAIAAQAVAGKNGHALRGTKSHVLDAPNASAFVVAARTRGAPGDRDGITLFLVPREAPGLSVQAQHRIDSTSAGIVTLDGVEVGADAVVGGKDRGADVLDAVIERAAVAASGELLGLAAEALERTLSYMKERVQFGVPIGSFQALKHRAARMFMEVELSRSAVMAAARALDEGSPDASRLVSVAKARSSDAAMLVANEAIQMHGGIGMTDEHDIGFFIKRARVLEQTFGDAAYHRNRFAALSGF